MTEYSTKTEKRPKTRGGKILPALCSVFGTLVLLAVILSALPLAVPRILGCEVYSVISGSMEPALPKGSVVYVKKTDPAEVNAGDIVAFSDEGTPVTHRVIENRSQTKELITKGDANDALDLYPVPYVNVLGLVKAHIPGIGGWMMLYSTREGKLTLVFFAFCGLLFRLLGSRIREREKQLAEAEKQAENEKTGGKEKNA